MMRIILGSFFVATLLARPSINVPSIGLNSELDNEADQGEFSEYRDFPRDGNSQVPLLPNLAKLDLDQGELAEECEEPMKESSNLETEKTRPKFKSLAQEPTPDGEFSVFLDSVELESELQNLISKGKIQEPDPMNAEADDSEYDWEMLKLVNEKAEFDGNA